MSERIGGRQGLAQQGLAVALTVGALTGGCTSYPYHGLTASIDVARLDDAKMAKLAARQRIRVVEALSVCDGTWQQIYAIKNAHATGAQRWKSASLLVTALGTAAIAGGFLASNHDVKVEPGTGKVTVSDPTAARWVTGLGLLTVGLGATGTFALSMSSSEAELDTLQPLLPQIEGARTALRTTLNSDDATVIERQIVQLEETCDGARQRVATYNRDEQLAAHFGTEAVKALDREITRKLDEAERARRSGAVMDVVAGGRRFDALARSLGFSSARILGEPWQVGSGGQRRHTVRLDALEPDLKKLAAANKAGQIAIGVYSPEGQNPSAFGVSVSLVGGDNLVGSDALLGRSVKPLIASAIDFDQAGGMSVAGTALSLAPYAGSVSSGLWAWLCRLRPPPLVSPAAGAGTLSVAGCPALVATGPTPTTAGLRTALRLPAAPPSGLPDDRLLIRADGLGPNTPGPAMAALLWLEGKPQPAADGD